VLARTCQSWTAAFAIALAGCAASPPPIADRAPRAPAADDPAFRVDAPAWLLAGDALTPAQDVVEVAVRAPAGVEVVDAWLADRPGVRLTREGDAFVGALDAAGLAPGDHDLLLAADASDAAFARRVVRRGHALYVVVSTDWDDPDNPDESLALQEELHVLHPALRITHLVGPYTFTDPDLSSARADALAAWVRDQRDRHGDEIGLHLHPWCSFVEDADVTCRDVPSTVHVYDRTGYTVQLAAYEPAELDALFALGDRIFAEHGLGKPTSFRAGGWTADADVLAALGRAGYLVDSSALNWARMEEWSGVGNGVLYEWNKAAWSSIGDTSQPYRPSTRDVLAAGLPNVGVLEAPDNGILVDYVTAGEMIEIFDANLGDGPLAAPRAYSIGYHPPNFDRAYADRMHGALDHVDDHLAADHAGPAVYVRMSDLATVWPEP
jgi:hypothetical protein